MSMVLLCPVTGKAYKPAMTHTVRQEEESFLPIQTTAPQAGRKREAE